ncbi:GNAT family N-acetyltransferase [Gemmatimonas sp.]|nr:GNAT family N-acetyltransferase [Gemmatimonas sp.]
MQQMEPPNATMAVRLMQEADLEAVAQLHISAFPEQLMSRLGVDVVRAYYAWQLRCGATARAFRAAVVGDRNGLAGFVIGGRYHGATSGFVKAYAGTLLLALARNPQLLGDRRVLAKLRAVTCAVVGVWFRRVAPSRPGPAHEPSFGVLALAVAPNRHGSGVAAQLMQELEGAAMAAGFRAMNLHVNTDNPRAIAFYEKRGWQRDGAHPWTGNMRLPLEHRP